MDKSQAASSLVWPCYTGPMAHRDVQPVTPEQFMPRRQAPRQHKQKNKYATPVGLKNLDFAVDGEKAAQQFIPLPFQGLHQAEAALQQGVIVPTLFLEPDDTQHQVVVFDPAPVGFSGFDGCITHSLALTGHGLFAVGRCTDVSLAGRPRAWLWFLLRRLATAQEVAIWQQSDRLSPHQLVDRVFEALTGQPRLSAQGGTP
jgi:hypothetical protein